MTINIKERLVGGIVLILFAIVIIFILDSKTAVPAPVATPAPKIQSQQIANAASQLATEDQPVAPPPAMATVNTHTIPAPQHPHITVAKTQIHKHLPEQKSKTTEKQHPHPLAKVAHIKNVTHKPVVAAEKKQLWHVQVGLFSQQANALQLEKKFKARGFKVSLVARKRKKKKMYAVLIGPVPKRTVALALAKQVKGMVVS